MHLNGKIVYVNEVALRLFGAKYREELQGRKMLDMVHAELHDLVRERIGEVENGGMAPLRELRIVRLDGREVAVEATAASIDWQGAVAVQSVLRDITARKMAEALFLQTEKLASVGRMAASIAHEINNPLAAVMNTVYLARKTPEVPEQAMEFLEIAEEELKRVSHITRQVLGFYRESSALKRVGVDSIMESTLDLLQSKIRAKQAKIEKRYRGDLAVNAVGGELRQVFSNLLVNSLECIGEYGTVKLRLTGGRCAKCGERTVRITVADNGSGIREAIQARMFEALFTTKGDTGTGLGLWVSKQIVEKHGGTIRFRSRATGAKTGTVFSVVLKAESNHPAARTQPRTARATRTQPRLTRQLRQRLAEELFKAGAFGGSEFFQRLVGGGRLVAEIDERRKHIVFQPVLGTRRGGSHAELRQLVLEFEHHALGGLFAYAGHAGEPDGVRAAQGRHQVGGAHASQDVDRQLGTDAADREEFFKQRLFFRQMKAEERNLVLAHVGIDEERDLAAGRGKLGKGIHGDRDVVADAVAVHDGVAGRGGQQGSAQMGDHMWATMAGVVSSAARDGACRRC